MPTVRFVRACSSACEPARRDPLERVPRRAEVRQQEEAARRQHPPDLAERAALVGIDQVVEHQRREHAIEARVGIRQRRRQTFVELHADARASQLPARDRQHLRIAVEPRRPRRPGGRAPGTAPACRCRNRRRARAHADRARHARRSRAASDPRAGTSAAAGRRAAAASRAPPRGCSPRAVRTSETPTGARDDYTPTGCASASRAGPRARTKSTSEVRDHEEPEAESPPDARAGPSPRGRRARRRAAGPSTQ